MEVNDELCRCFVLAIYNGALDHSRLSQRLESAKKQLVAPCAAAWQEKRIHQSEVAARGLAEHIDK